MLAQEEQEREYQPRQVTQSQTSTSRPSQEEVEEEDVEMVEHPGGQGGLIPRRIVRARQPVRITRPAEPMEEGGGGGGSMPFQFTEEEEEEEEEEGQQEELRRGGRTRKKPRRFREDEMELLEEMRMRDAAMAELARAAGEEDGGEEKGWVDDDEENEADMIHLGILRTSLGMDSDDEDDDEDMQEQEQQQQQPGGGGGSSWAGPDAQGWSALFPGEYPEELRKHDFTGTQKEGGPPADFPLNYKSLPIEFFKAFITEAERQRWTKQTNEYARVKLKAGQPGGKYPEFKDVEHADIDKVLAVYIIAALKRMPSMRHLFLNPNFPGRRIFGDARVREIFPRKFKRFQELRACLHVAAKIEAETEEGKKDKLFKIRKLLELLKKQCKRWWVPGEFLAGDEASVEIQGRFGCKIKFNNKKRKEGAQVEVLAERGYVIFFIFRPFFLGPPSPRYLCASQIMYVHKNI
jgi:hypothetical protein